MIKWAGILSAGKMNTVRKSVFKNNTHQLYFGKNGGFIWPFGVTRGQPGKTGGRQYQDRKPGYKQR